MTIIDGKYHYSDPSMPLEGMRDAYISGQVLPSAEAGLFDFAQHHSHNDGSGINAIYPSPSGFYDENQATIITDGEATRTNNVDETGVFHYDGLTGTLHNTGIEPAVMDFNIFNSYIHHDSSEEGFIAIPYVSDFTVNAIIQVYPNRSAAFQAASFINRGEQPTYNPDGGGSQPQGDSTTTTTTAAPATTTTTSAPGGGGGGGGQTTTTTTSNPANTTTTTTTAAPSVTTTTTSAPATTTTTVAPGGGDLGGGDFSGGGGGGGYGGGY